MRKKLRPLADRMEGGAKHREVFGLVRQRVVDNIELLLDSPIDLGKGKIELRLLVAMWEDRAGQLASEIALLLRLVLAFPEIHDPDVVLHTKALLRGVSCYTTFVLRKSQVMLDLVTTIFYPDTLS